MKINTRISYLSLFIKLGQVYFFLNSDTRQLQNFLRVIIF